MDGLMRRLVEILHEGQRRLTQPPLTRHGAPHLEEVDPQPVLVVTAFKCTEVNELAGEAVDGRLGKLGASAISARPRSRPRGVKTSSTRKARSSTEEPFRSSDRMAISMTRSPSPRHSVASVFERLNFGAPGPATSPATKRLRGGCGRCRRRAGFLRSRSGCGRSVEADDSSRHAAHRNS